ncbi:MAG: hypothetical protein SVR08_13055 [Spirochaetota bacterium]|nr:hypothetical protein [Spirochaetota bacterium]
MDQESVFTGSVRLRKLCYQKRKRYFFGEDMKLNFEAILMKKIIIVLGLFFLFSCTVAEKKKTPPAKVEEPQQKAEIPQKKVEEKEEKKILEPSIDTGFVDEDTYNVRVLGENESAAIDNAKHRILKDIVSVRMMNRSRYTDITKIKMEFSEPLKKGKIIHRREIGDGLEIYFQIRAKGLKQKFEIK